MAERVVINPGIMPVGPMLEEPHSLAQRVLAINVPGETEPAGRVTRLRSRFSNELTSLPISFPASGRAAS